MKFKIETPVLETLLRMLRAHVNNMGERMAHAKLPIMERVEAEAKKKSYEPILAKVVKASVDMDELEFSEEDVNIVTTLCKESVTFWTEIYNDEDEDPHMKLVTKSYIEYHNGVLAALNPPTFPT